MDGKVRFYQKTIFWQRLRDTFGLLAGPTSVSLHEFGSADGYVIAAGLSGMFGVLMGMWMVDHDKDGIVDLFQ